MRKTILTCDRCNEEVADLFEVGAGKRTVTYRSSQSCWTVSGQLDKEWCRNCCISLGIFGKSHYIEEDKAVVIQTPPPTLEELIREFIREEINERR